jgi:hypothetical protein
VIYEILVNHEVTITEVNPWIPCELVADLLGSAKYTLGTTAFGQTHKDSRDEMGRFFVVGQCCGF